VARGFEELHFVYMFVCVAIPEREKSPVFGSFMMRALAVVEALWSWPGGSKRVICI